MDVPKVIDAVHRTLRWAQEQDDKCEDVPLAAVVTVCLWAMLGVIRHPDYRKDGERKEGRDE